MSSTNYKIPTVATLRKKTGSDKHLFEVVSTFAGGGGSSTGYRMAGGKVLAISEFIPEAQKTYHANWPETYIFPLGLSLSRMSIKNKFDAGANPDQIIKKELSLCGVQRPSDHKLMIDHGFKQWLQVGDFCGYAKET